MKQLILGDRAILPRVYPWKLPRSPLEQSSWVWSDLGRRGEDCPTQSQDQGPKAGLNSEDSPPPFVSISAVIYACHHYTNRGD